MRKYHARFGGGPTEKCRAFDNSPAAYYYNAGSYDRLFRLPKTRHYGNSNRLERPDSGWMTCHVSAKIMPSVPGRGELNITYLIVVLPYQAASYALAQAGIRPRREARAGEQWGHDFVQAEFNGQLINRRKIYPPRLRAILAEVYILRQTADYKRDYITELKAARAVGKATEFVEAIQRREGGGSR